MSAAGAGHIGDYEACAFTVEGVGRFVAGDSASPTVGRPGRGNAEPEVRVEMVAPSSRVDAIVEALIAAHPYEEPAFDVYPVASNQALGGRVGAFEGSWDELDRTGRRRLPARGPADRPGRLGATPRRVAVSPGRR